MSFRMLAILAISMSIMQLLFHLAIIGWFLKRHDYEPVIIIPLVLGSLFGNLLWVTLYVHNLNPFLKSFGLELSIFFSTLWVICFVIVLYVIVPQQEKKKQAMVQENSDDQEYFAYTLMIV
jgi:TctA family transporter